jgi:two-component sensor histidine kinase
MARKYCFSVRFVSSIILFWGLIYPHNYLFAQNPDDKIDAAKRYYDEGLMDSLKVISHEILRSDEFKLDHSLIGKMNFYLAQANSMEGNVDSTDYYFNHAIAAYKKAGDIAWVGQLYVRKGFIYRQKQLIDTALIYYKAALPYLKQGKDTLWLGYANDHLGFMLVRKGDYYGALKHYQDAVTAWGSLNIPVNMGAAYNSIGMIFRKTKDTEKEKEAYKKAIELLENVDETKYLGEAYSNLSELYLMEGETEMGFSMLEKAKRIFENLNHQIGLYSYNAVLSYYYQNSNPPYYQKVIEYGKMGAKIAQDIESFREYADACYYVGNAYLNLQQYKEAGSWLRKGHQAAANNGYPTELARLSEELSTYYAEIGNPAKAYQYLRQYNSLNDSLASTEKIKEFTNLDLSFKHRQEQLRDSLLAVQEKQLLVYEFDQELQQKQIVQLALIFSVVILILIGGFILLSSRRNKKQAEMLAEKNDIINKSLHEKELLLKEIHHRVKNNFQTISSLLDLQSREVTDEQAKSNIQEGQSRIKSMALIHQKLYQHEDLSVIDFQDYLDQLCRQNLASFRLEKVQYRVKAHDIKLDIDTSIPLGLIINELITNSCKYAFTQVKEGEIRIEIKKLETKYLITYFDSGPGLPENLDIDKIPSLGLKLVKRLSKQLHGALKYDRLNPAFFSISFKDHNQRREME